MNLALTEMRRAKLRFGLLTAAVALLVFLIVFLSSLSGALLRTITGALESVPVDGLVLADNARGNLQSSRLQPGMAADVAAVPGVESVVPVAVLPVAATVAGQTSDLQLFGIGSAQPRGLRSGSFPSGPGQIAVDASEDVDLGAEVRIAGLAEPLIVTGKLVGAQFGSDTGWVPMEEYNRIVTELNPGIPSVPVNAIGFTVTPGSDAAAVAAQVQQSVSGTTGYDLAAAVNAIPGKGSISQTFGLLVGITFMIGVVVVGFFFLILTVQKLKAFTLLRATGASTARLARTVVGQIAAVVLVASALATVMAWGALQGLSSGLPVRIDPITTSGVVAAVLAASLVAGLLSVRRIAAIDPATAAGAR